MFFRALHFRKILAPELAEAAALLANETLDSKGEVAYGNKFSDHTLDNWSSNQEKDDTHVAMLVNIAEMGFDSDERDIHIERLGDDDHKEFLKDRIDQVERENKRLREKT